MKRNDTENIVTLYREYRDLTLWGALSGDFDPGTDQAAYNALVTGNVKRIRAAIKDRKAKVGTPDFKKVKKGETPERRKARVLLDAAR